MLGSGMSLHFPMPLSSSSTLAAGEKVVPIPQEGLIMSSPMVIGAVMFGREKNQCGILIEPAPSHAIDPTDPIALPKFRNMIW